MDMRLAYSRLEAMKLVPWGRNKFDDDLRESVCKSFKVGRRVYITHSQLEEYVERRSEMEE